MSRNNEERSTHITNRRMSRYFFPLGKIPDCTASEQYADRSRNYNLEEGTLLLLLCRDLWGRALFKIMSGEYDGRTFPASSRTQEESIVVLNK